MSSYNFIFPSAPFYSSVPPNMQNFIYNLPNQALYNNYWINNKFNTPDLNSSFPRYDILDSSGLALLPSNSSYDCQVLPTVNKGRRRKYHVNGDTNQSAAPKKSKHIIDYKEDELFRNRKNQLLHQNNLSGSIEPFRSTENAEEVKIRWEILVKASKVMTNFVKLSKFSDVARKVQRSIYQKKFNEKGFVVESQNDKSADDRVYMINYRYIKFPKPRIIYNTDSSIKHDTSEKQYTILSNVQRRNIQKLASDNFDEISQFTLAGQGETIRLDQKLSESNYLTINDRDENGYTALMWASSWGHKHTVELLLYRGARLDIVGNDGENPFMFAVQEGRKDVVEYLLKCGDDINHCDWSMTNSLIVAARKGHTDCFQLLLEWGIDFTAINDDGETVWDAAAIKPCRKPIRVILRDHLQKLLLNHQDAFDQAELTSNKLYKQPESTANKSY